MVLSIIECVLMGAKANHLFGPCGGAQRCLPFGSTVTVQGDSFLII